MSFGEAARHGFTFQQDHLLRRVAGGVDLSYGEGERQQTGLTAQRETQRVASELLFLHSSDTIKDGDLAGVPFEKHCDLQR